MKSHAERESHIDWEPLFHISAILLWMSNVVVLLIFYIYKVFICQSYCVCDWYMVMEH